MESNSGLDETLILGDWKGTGRELDMKCTAK